MKSIKIVSRCAQHIERGGWGPRISRKSKMEARGLPGLRGRKTIAMAKEYTVHLRGYRLLENIRNLTELATLIEKFYHSTVFRTFI